MNTKRKAVITTLILTGLVAAQPAQAQAGGSVQHASQAIGHSAKAVGHSVVGTAKLASGVVAVPLIAIGASGQASQQAGESLWDIANEPIGTPLPVSDETVTAGPSPARAINE
jgi:hypothetical protein